MNIYVGNLDYGVNEKDLEDLFSEYGKVNSVKIIMDKYTGKSKGFGFVEMEKNEEASKALKELDGALYEDRKITVNEAKQRKNSYSNF